ncbi:MAG: SRPBCC family protein [Gordonia sp. (in: high G+C Gram-positive bacteria)]
MREIHLTRTIPAPIDDVFDAFTDHERLADLPMVISARLIRHGDTEKNGLGAIREVNGGVVWLREEITGWQRPTVMEYRIRKARPEVQHELGRVEFTEVPGGTHIDWISRFGLNVPIMNGVVEVIFGATFGQIFTLILAQVSKRAVAARRG